MGKPILSNFRISIAEYIGNGGQRGKLKHLSTLRKRKKFDSPSSGERKGNSLNQVYVITRECCIPGVAGLYRMNSRIHQGVTNPIAS
jgi:hypothetical protein